MMKQLRWFKYKELIHIKNKECSGKILKNEMIILGYMGCYLQNHGVFE